MSHSEIVSVFNHKLYLKKNIVPKAVLTTYYRPDRLQTAAPFPPVHDGLDVHALATSWNTSYELRATS